MGKNTLDVLIKQRLIKANAEGKAALSIEWVEGEKVKVKSATTEKTGEIISALMQAIICLFLRIEKTYSWDKSTTDSILSDSFSTARRVLEKMRREDKNKGGRV